MTSSRFTYRVYCGQDDIPIGEWDSEHVAQAYGIAHQDDHACGAYWELALALGEVDP